MAVDGKYNIVVKSPMGDQPSTVELKSSGASLTGTQSAQGRSQDITDGKVDGNAVSWKNSITTPFPMTLEFSGTVDGNSLNGSVKAGSFGSFPFTGTRA
ncbi:MAG: hypothetical protein JO261_07135 [Alphaproteobacteria bacterium]|nr:hypothetical protein [Alphaproteobacteria bacterium]MBV9693456.1 hypothetical protein [Alphaproteobacteria bacterium]